MYRLYRRLYITHSSSHGTCIAIQPIQPIQPIQLYSYTAYTVYISIQLPSAPPLVKICSELDVSPASCRLCGECNNNNNDDDDDDDDDNNIRKRDNNNNNNVRTNYKFSAPLNLGRCAIFYRYNNILVCFVNTGV